MTPKKLKILIFAMSILFVGIIVVAQLYFMHPEERALNAKLANLRGQTRLSEVIVPHGTETACIFHPYSLDYGKTRGADLKKMFGGINYSDNEKELIKYYGAVNEHGWGMYSVHDNKLRKRLDVYSIHLKSGKTFRAGCYRTNTVCLEYLPAQPDKKPHLLIDICN